MKNHHIEGISRSSNFVEEVILDRTRKNGR